MSSRFDCVVCGSCTIDLLIRPVNLAEALGTDRLHRVDPIQLSVGGIVSNAGITMAKLGLRVCAFSAVGQDQWGEIVRNEYRCNGLDTSKLQSRAELPTSVTAAMVDERGDRSFVHNQGAPKLLTARDFRDAMGVFAASRSMLLGYYPLLPAMLDDLAGLFREIRETGCLTALDAAGGGGSMKPLDEILPHTDVYVPSFTEASTQTGEKQPEKILDRYRSCGAPGILGVKLGSAGAVLSAAAGEFVEIAPITPPGKVVDTTGAGDAFFAGLLYGLLNEMSVGAAGRLAAAAGAWSTTGIGATATCADLETLQRHLP